MGALYQISFPNGKSYIGITSKRPERRWAEHRYKTDTNREDRILNRALRKYGADKASFDVLVVADDWQYLTDLERRAIAVFGTFGSGGYNMTAGGEGALGYRHTPESLAIMSATHIGKAHHSVPHSPEARAKMSAARMGKKIAISPEAKERLRRRMSGNTYAAGLVHSAETVARRSVSIVSRSRGVSWCKQTSKWRAHITIGKKMKCLGRYAVEADALAARAAAVRERLVGAAQ